MALRVIALLVIVLSPLWLCSASSADVPRMMDYQGKVTNAAGAPLNGTFDMTFSIYPDTLGSPADWSETQQDVEVKRGIFSVLLGSVDSIPAWIFDGNIKYLGVRVESDPEMRPLKPMVSVAYAYKAGAADGGAGGWVDDGAVVRLETDTDSVGIGTATPTEKLDVAGNIHASGTIQSGSSITIDGANDKITATSGTIDFDDENVITTGKATIGPGHTNTGVAAFVAGANNTASNYLSTVGGGDLNTASGDRSTVGGGTDNTASGNQSTVSGGGGNTAGDVFGTVGGGRWNTASGYGSTVSGGESNTASYTHGTVSGGHHNTASGDRSTVGGGSNNTASGGYSTVSGGNYNINAGEFSVIPGGQRDTLTAAAGHAMAFGTGVYVDSPYRVVFFEDFYSGRLGINRDDRDGGINYPIHVGTATSNGNGARLTEGGVWTDATPVASKQNGQPLEGQELLAKIVGLSVETWQFRDSGERHIGPRADEFVEAFDVGTSREDGTRENQYLASSDVAGVALAGVKELVQQNQELRQIVERLRQRIAELEKAK